MGTALRLLSKSSMANIRTVAANKTWHIVYDNLNFRRIKHDQRLDNKDSFVSGTTATLIQCDSTDGIFNQNAHKKLCLQDLLITKNNHDQFKEVSTYHLVNALKRHFEVFQGLQNDAPIKNLLQLKKSETFPLPSMDINESSVEGNKDVIETIINSTLELPRQWFHNGRHVVIAGDQLTIKNIRSVMRVGDTTGPIVPPKFQMIFAATILRTYYGSVTTPGSLAHIAVMLGRKRISTEKLDFHAVNELIYHVFEAAAWRAWRVAMEDDAFSSDCGESSEEFARRKSSEIFEKLVSGANSFFDHKNNVSFNGSLLFRDMMLYVELSHAIKSGDIGRIEEVIKWLTLMLQAGCTRNYAHELIHLHCGLQYAWPK
ncbi:hypothetical protein BGZ79_009006 [Entomortierella chlamydospora]|nr:hypothetical protein BGZ79_009006 [Entomortierella chlamydospora]